MLPTIELRRLLNLFSLKTLKEHWASRSTKKDDVIEEVLAVASTDDIVDFTLLYHPTTKHHLHLFDLPEIELSSLPANPLADERLHRHSEDGTERRWFFLPRLTNLVYFRDPLETKEVTFLWPITVTCHTNYLELRFTIMEKNMRSHVTAPGRVIKVQRNREETTIQAQVLGNLGLPGLLPMDLNRGVKRLWQSGIIDAPSVQFKKSRATLREVMDGEYLVKRDDPALYNDIANRPILKAIFKWLGDDPIGLDHFSVEANLGLINFPTFSELDQGATHVVRQILNHN